MSYLDQFSLHIEEEKFSSFLQLWEEYCMIDSVDGKELVTLLSLIKNSTFRGPFGKLTETVLSLWQKCPTGDEKNKVLSLILDIQTSNTPFLAQLAEANLKERFGKHPYFGEMLRIVGLRGRHSFQGAISNFELLNHMKKGAFVFHTGGWGVGEVMDFSLLQEHVILEFEGFQSLKDLSFENAFNHLEPLAHEHFLARRFGNPDRLELEAKKDPLLVLHSLLRDLGPKTAIELKEELCELVIPEEDWGKWWQAARAKLKKDTKIQSPKTARDPFVLRESELSHEERLRHLLKEISSPEKTLLVIYNFLRDFPDLLKNPQIKEELKERLIPLLEVSQQAPQVTIARRLQASFLLEDLFPKELSNSIKEDILALENIERILNLMETVALKKRALVSIRKMREDWIPCFIHLLFLVPQNQLRDYLFKELISTPQGKELLKGKTLELLHQVTLYPEAFFWYFQKLIGKESVPHQDSEHKRAFLEAYLVLLHYLDGKEQYRDLLKKMAQFLTAKRYEVIRTLIEGASVIYLKEFLLLASKCLCFSKRDLSILRSLAEVVQPELSTQQKEVEEVIWTTAQGFQKIQERIQEIGNVEMIDNAHEIEEARSHGDLRENSEYKYALERRSRLQSELSALSKQLNMARIITENDVIPGEVGPGTIVEVEDSKGNVAIYTLLGPWDADPENNILSFQSKFAQAMHGRKEGENFSFQGEDYAVKGTKSYFG